MKKASRRSAQSAKPFEDNQIVGRENEERISKILSSIGKVRDTFGSGNVFGDQDMTLQSTVGVLRISCKHKQQAEPNPSKKSSIPTLPYKEICEPIAYTESKGLGEIPVTAVTWSGNSSNPGKSDFVILTMRDFLKIMRKVAG